MTFAVILLTPWSCQMSKRKPATVSKHTQRPKISARAQRAAQAVVRSPKDSRLRSVETGSTESPPKHQNDSKQEAPLHENPVTALQQEAPLVQQEAPHVENLVTALQDGRKETVTDNASKKGFELSSVTANVRAYQAKLLEMAQANMQFAFEFAQRLAAIRSPVEFLSVNAEFTSKRLAMFLKYSKEMAELTKR
jgi:hypothetical protein